MTSVRSVALSVRQRARRRRKAQALQRDLATWTGPVKVHLGAGGVRLPGWINTDFDGTADYVLDARRPWSVAEVDYVYADNVLEHFTLPELREVLAMAHAAMVPGARLRACVPDAERNARMYLEGGPDAERVLARHRSHGYDADYPQELLRVVFSLNDHASGYQHDFTSLSAELTRAGFRDVRRVAVGESDDEVLRGLEARDSDIDDLLLLTVDAIR